MNRIDTTFQALRDAKRKALMPFITAGFPDRNRFRGIIREIAQVADLIEIGIPFSDPLADGPTIQRASNKALCAGMNLVFALEEIRNLREATQCPLLVMSYVNPLMQFGFESFVRQVSEAGADGLIIPDLPLEEQAPFMESISSVGLYLIQLLTPTASPQRAQNILSQANGFVYLVTVAGTTGARKDFDRETLDFLSRSRKATSLPLAAGFGISSPAHIDQLSPYVDGMIVGSALLDAIERGEDAAGFLEGLTS